MSIYGATSEINVPILFGMIGSTSTTLQTLEIGPGGFDSQLGGCYLLEGVDFAISGFISNTMVSTLEVNGVLLWASDGTTDAGREFMTWRGNVPFLWNDAYSIRATCNTTVACQIGITAWGSLTFPWVRQWTTFP